MPRNRHTIGVLTPTSSGSLGDQAMIDAIAGHLIGNMGRQVLIGPNVFRTRAEARGPAGTGKVQIMAALAGMVLRSKHVGLIGADVLDGVYGHASVLKRLRILRLAHLCGAQTRVFGCSWSQNPSTKVIAALRQAPWLRLLARDPVSQARMQSQLGREVPLVADLAFLLKPAITTPAGQHVRSRLEAWRSAGKTILGVNLSGHSLRGLPEQGVGAFSDLIAGWLDRKPDRMVLLLPHDSRKGLVGDMMVLGLLHDRLKERFQDRLHFAPDTLNAWEVKALTGSLDLVLTGRMHLAIAALGMGTPVLCTVYQGKFEGLMAHFGIDGLTMSPDDVLRADIGERVEALMSRRAEIGAKLDSRLPDVLFLSQKNLEGM